MLLLLAGAAAAPSQPSAEPKISIPHAWIEVVAGGGSSGDGGKAVDAVFVGVGGLAVDAQGTVYVADSGSNRVRRIDARTGIVTTIAGTGLVFGSSESKVATERPLRGPDALALDPEDRSLYVSETLGRRVQRIDLANGTMEDLGTPAGGFGTPGGMVWTAAGLLVADAPRGQVWRLGPQGWTGLLPEDARQFGGVRTLARDSRGGVYLTEYFAHRVLRWDPGTGAVSTAVGIGASGKGTDGVQAAQAALRTPDGIAVDPAGNLLVADKGNHRICRVDVATGIFKTLIASSREKLAQRWTPGPLAVDAKGNLWVGDIERNRVLRFAPGSTLPVVVAGEGDIRDGGPAREARLAHPGGLTSDDQGNVYIADTLHHRIRKVDATTGVIRTIAGTGLHGYNGDGIPATQAWLTYPAELQVDDKGRVYFGDYYNNRVRRVDPESGLISTVAGTGQGGEDGDGGPATSAKMLNPHALLLEGNSLIVASAVSSRMRQIDLASGKISAVPLGEGVPEELVFYGVARWNGGLVMAFPRPGGIEILKDGKLLELVGRPDVNFPRTWPSPPRASCSSARPAATGS
jgi:sugar lactone lactonase YvrE